MQVYGLPEELPAPTIDFKNYDHNKVRADEAEHQRKLEHWLRERGYTGKRTGQVVRFGVGDGYALYMLAEGSKSCLVHLPYGDAWQYPDVRYLPKAEIVRRIDADAKLVVLFKKAE